MGDTKSGGGKFGAVASLAFSLVLACLGAAAFLYLHFSVGAENEALRARIGVLDRQLAALSDAFADLNNKTQILIKNREQDHQPEYKEEEDVDEEGEYEDDMDTEYDDPNEDDSEYEEEEGEDDYEHDVRDRDEAMRKVQVRRKRSPRRIADESEGVGQIRGVPRNFQMFQMMRGLKIDEFPGVSKRNQLEEMKLDSYALNEYPLISRKRRNNRREDVEVFTQNMTPLSSDLIAAHYGADETKCLNQPHLRHCDINHKRLHPGGVIKDWNNIFTSSSMLTIKEGKLTVNSAGLYFVYAQVFYSNAHDVNSFRIIHNDQPIMQCTTHTNHEAESTPRCSCFTGGLVYMNERDHLYIRDIEERRHTLFERSKTFFGLFRVGNTLMV